MRVEIGTAANHYVGFLFLGLYRRTVASENISIDDSNVNDGADSTPRLDKPSVRFGGRGGHFRIPDGSRTFLMARILWKHQ